MKLLEQLIDWAFQFNYPAVPIQPTFDEWCLFLADTFQRCVDADGRWLWYAIDNWPGDVMTLAPWLRTVHVDGCDFPANSTWFDWIEGVVACPF